MLAAAIQFDVRVGEVHTNLGCVEQLLAAAADRGCDLVVLPEMWPTSFLPKVGEQQFDESDAALARLAELTRLHGLIACGSAYGRPLADDPGVGLPTNRMHIFGDGQLLSAYDKVHLFSPTAEGESFAPGLLPPPTIATRDARLSGLICYDLRFPDILRVPFRAGAEVLLISAQWPSTRDAQWRALVQGRAVEGQCFIVACNRTGQDVIGRRQMVLDFPGNSLIVNPHGEILVEGLGEDGVLTAELDISLARSLRVRVPVDKDERRDLYRAWDAGLPSDGQSSQPGSA